MGICSGIGNSILEEGSLREWGGSSGPWKRSGVNTLIPPQNCQLITPPGHLEGTIAESVVWAMTKLYMASRCFFRPKQCFLQSWITKLKKTRFHVKYRSLILLWFFFFLKQSPCLLNPLVVRCSDFIIKSILVDKGGLGGEAQVGLWTGQYGLLLWD